MVKVYRFLLVLTILFLIISGLNISNRGINSLTLEARPPVLAVLNLNDEVRIFALGQTHTYSKQKMSADVILLRQQIKKGSHAVGNYLQRIEKAASTLLNLILYLLIGQIQV